MKSLKYKGIYFGAYVFHVWCDKNSQDENDDLD